MTGPVPLTRAALAERGGPTTTAPVRIIHLGLGAFHRSHQAWYTAHAADSDQWGIAAFTGRSAQAAQVLSSQEGLYTLTTRGPEHDAVEVIPSIVETHHGGDVATLCALMARPEVAIVTLTVTEAGYGAAPGQDTPLRRLVHALEARYDAQAGPIAVVPCDNIPANGEFVKAQLLDLARDVRPGMVDWLEHEVSYVSTSVDRITPRWDGNEVAAVREAGWIDAAPVVTEPFSDWALEGEFPGGRPQWESAGAVFVDDIRGHEERKLWLLNGAHSLMAWWGLRRGLSTVAEAAASPACMALVRDYWDEAVPHLPVGVEHERYRDELVARWGNARMEHHLAQIALESATKLSVRVGAVAVHERAAGRPATACAQALAEWIAGVAELPLIEDSRQGEIARALTAMDPVTAMISIIDANLAGDAAFVAHVRDALAAHSRG